MPLPDPELELLREMLHEDPGNDAFLIVGWGLVERERWEEALEVLEAGMEAVEVEPDEGWALLARAALRSGRVPRALAALERMETDPETHEDSARLRVFILEAAGRRAEAAEAGAAFLEVYPDDALVQATIARLDAPPPDPAHRIADPLVSLERAEAYAAIGRPERAVRVLRRLFFHFPQDVGFTYRIAELRGWPSEPADDLSDEIREQAKAPPGLVMPAPALGVADTWTSQVDLADPGEQTGPTDFDPEEIRRQIEGDTDDEPFLYGADFDGREPDEEPTVVLPRAALDATPEEIERRIQAAKEKRKRRSLLQNN